MAEILKYTADAFLALCTVKGILFMIAGAILGMILGAIPGLSGGTLMILILPLCYKLNPVYSMALFIAIHVGATSGGCVGSILLGIPGTNSSLATCWDGYPQCLKDGPVRPLSLAVVCNFLGTVPGIIIAMFCCRSLALVAVKMGPWEYAAMCFCAICMVVGLAKDNMARAFLGVGLAILLSCIGQDAIDGQPRFTFGSMYLYSGFNIISIMLGMFAAKIIIVEYAKRTKVHHSETIKVSGFKWPGKDLTAHWGSVIRSFLIGAGIGFLPGLGAPTSTVVAYSTEKSLSKEPESFGKGNPVGIIAPETANNAGIGGALIPMLALGIPGDAVMVYFMSALEIQGIAIGPLLIRTNPEVVYMVFAGAIVAALLCLLVEAGGMRLFPAMLKVPYHYLYAIIVVIFMIGSYMVTRSCFGIIVTLVSCLVGLFMDYFKIPTSPFVMMFILCPIFEKNVRQAMNYSLVGVSDFFVRPVSLIFILLGVGVLVWQFVSAAKAKRKLAGSDK